MFKRKSIIQSTCVCFYALITCTFGVFHIMHEENHNDVNVIANFTTTTATECIISCTQMKECHSIFEWIENRCVLLAAEKNNETNNHQSVNLEKIVKTVKEISDDVVFIDDLSTANNACCSWGEFAACSVSCNGGERTRTRICYTGELKRIETDTKRCNERKCTPSPCMWKDWDIFGDTLKRIDDVNDWQACQKACVSTGGCRTWIWVTGNNCYMKKTEDPKKGTFKEGALSGLRECINNST